MKNALATISDVMRARDAAVSAVIALCRTHPAARGLFHGERQPEFQA
jgi:hypothetical protein